jgi:hypothetical protein
MANPSSTRKEPAMNTPTSTTATTPEPQGATVGPARRRRRGLGAALAVTTLLASAGITAFGATAANASPNDPIQSLTITVKTGFKAAGSFKSDDKRRDSDVTLAIITKTHGTQLIDFSPASPDPGPGPDAIFDKVPWKLDVVPPNMPETVGTFAMPVSGVTPSDIKSFKLFWTSGHNGWTSNDQWDFGGIDITETNTSSENFDLLSNMAENHHFNLSSQFALKGLTLWCGNYSGMAIIPPNAPNPVTASVCTAQGITTAVFTLSNRAVINVCGQNFTLPPGSIPLTGTATKMNKPKTGWTEYTLVSPPMPPVGEVLTLVVDVSPDGSVVLGTATLSNLPPTCVSPKIVVNLTRDPNG